MSRFRRSFVVVVSLLVVVALLPGAAEGGSGFFQPAARPAARSSVTVDVWPRTGLFGYVTSSNPHLCANQRQVIVYKRTASGGLRRIGSARATNRYQSYQWLLRTSKADSGVVVAVTAAKAGCRTSSKRLAVAPKSGDGIPECPSTADVCHLKIIKLGGVGGNLFRFQAGATFNVSTHYGPPPWCCWLYSQIEWNWRDGIDGRPVPGYLPRVVTWWAYKDHAYPNYAVYMRGYFPNPDSNGWEILDATAPAWHLSAGVSWRTPNLPGRAPGSDGGPLYFSQEPNEKGHGTDIFIGGYLYRK